MRKERLIFTSRYDYMRISCKYVGKYISANLEDELCILYNIPDKSKSIAFEALAACAEKNFKIVVINWKNYDNFDMNWLCSLTSDDIVVFDNADLYIDKVSMPENIAARKVIMCMRLPMYIAGKDARLYTVVNVDGNIEIKRRAVKL